MSHGIKTWGKTLRATNLGVENVVTRRIRVVCQDSPLSRWLKSFRFIPAFFKRVSSGEDTKTSRLGVSVPIKQVDSFLENDFKKEPWQHKRQYPPPC